MASENQQKAKDEMGGLGGLIDRSNPKNWQILDAADFAAWDFPPVEWIIDGLLPKRGLAMMGGAPKGSKSLLWLYLMLAMACRRVEVLGHFKIREYPNILYISREDGGDRIK